MTVLLSIPSIPNCLPFCISCIYCEFQSMERILYLWDKYSNICDTMSP